LTEPQERVEFLATREVIREVSIFVFGLLTDADVAWMAQAGVQRPIKDREILIHEGRPLESVIFLLQGECVVTEHAAGEIARLGVGEIVGEMSFLDSAPPSATVTAVGDGLALFLDGCAQAGGGRRLRLPLLPRSGDLPGGSYAQNRAAHRRRARP
jgi:Cyclic nucleotide-binding domain